MDSMTDEKRRPIDKLRDSAFSMTIAGGPEEGKIVGFVKIGERGLILKEGAIYEPILADQVDPDRTNPTLPHSQQKILSFGSTDEIVGRVLLTGEGFLNKNYLSDQDCTIAMELTWEMTGDLLAMRGYQQEMLRKITEAESTLGTKTSSGFVLPAVDGLRQTVEAFFQRAHHMVKALMGLNRLFFGEQITHPDSLLNYVAEKGLTMRDLVQDGTPLLRFVWHVRNSIEHPKNTQRLLISDFRMNPKGEVEPPMLEHIHPQAAHSSVPVATVLRRVTEDLTFLVEATIVALAAEHAEFGAMPIGVMELEESQRRYPHLRFSYAVRMGDEWRRLG